MSSAKRSSRRKPLAVKRLPVTFASDNRRVITRFFDPGSKGRMQNIVERIAQLDDDEVARLLDEVFQRFRTRHSNIVSVLEQNFRNAAVLLGECGRRRSQSPAAARLVLHDGVLDRVGGAVQSVDRASPESARSPRRGGPVHHEPAGDRRGARFVDRLSDRHHLLRSTNSGRSAESAHEPDQRDA